MQNTLYTNDNLFILYGMNSESVDLIYLDPPFNSKRLYSAPVGSKAAGSSFKDMWTWEDVNDAYLEKLAADHPLLTRYISSIQGLHSKEMMSYITYMTQRIIEMHRVLKETVSFYLHCDPTASHYLKELLDYVFGKDNFRNEIVWKRKTSVGSTKYIGNAHDVILHYLKNRATISYNNLYSKYDQNYIDKQYRYSDEKGRYRIHELVANKALTGGGSSYTYQKYTPRYGWLISKEKLLELEKNDMIVWSKTGVPRRKLYLDETKGNTISDVWDDIPIALGKERTGYPTQNPLALLERIIKASSKEGDVVLDPFCGCATTCVAAQQLKRKWIGIDIEEKAADLLIERLEKDGYLNDSFKFKEKGQDFVHRLDIPQRTDVERIDVSEKSVKDRLFKQQNGHCNGCMLEFNIFNLEVNHVVPKAKGGGDYFENYQLLCSNCNKIKGARPMEYLRMKITAREELLKNQLRFGG